MKTLLAIACIAIAGCASPKRDDPTTIAAPATPPPVSAVPVATNSVKCRAETVLIPEIDFRDADIFSALVFLVHTANGIPEWIEPVKPRVFLSITMDKWPEPSPEEARKSRVNEIRKQQHYALLFQKCGGRRVDFQARELTIIKIARVLSGRVGLRAAVRDGKLVILNRDGSVLAK